MTDAVQNLIVALAALAALAYVSRRIVSLFRPPATQHGCEHCALPALVQGTAESRSDRSAAAAPAGRRR